MTLSGDPRFGRFVALPKVFWVVLAWFRKHEPADFVAMNNLGSEQLYTKPYSSGYRGTLAGVVSRPCRTSFWLFTDGLLKHEPVDVELRYITSYE